MPPKRLDRRASISSSSSPSTSSPPLPSVVNKYSFRGRKKVGPYSYEKDFKRKDPDEIDYAYHGQSRNLSPRGFDDAKQILETKPCRICGREMTPRKAWLRNWNDIKYCSVSCKSWHGTVIIGKKDDYKDSINKETSLGLLESCFLIQESTKPRQNLEKRRGLKMDLDLRLDIDAWIQGTMMKLTDINNRKHIVMLEKFGGIPLEEVAASMWQELHLHRHIHPEDPNLTIIPPYITNIMKNKLPYNPGLREKIRRAARRLVVFPLEDSEFAFHFGADSQDLHPIELCQDHGRTRLDTVKKVSYAKQEIYIRRKK